MLIHMEKKYEDKIERIREEHQMEISVLENRIQSLEEYDIQEHLYDDIEDIKRFVRIQQERNDNMSGMLIHMEKKYEDKIERIREEHQMEISVLENRIQYLEQMMMGCSIIVGDGYGGNCAKIPVVANINSRILTICLSLPGNGDYYPFSGAQLDAYHIREYYEGIQLITTNIYFENIRYMKQLKKLQINICSNYEPIFDFGIINNGVLEELLLCSRGYGYNFRVDFSTIVKIPTLKKIIMLNIPGSDTNYDIKTYCSSNNIELIIL
jgi:hypothetical protein